MPTIEPYAAKTIWDPPIYSQAVKVTGAQTILYIAGQVAYDEAGNPAHRGDFKAQARATLNALKAQVEAGGGTMRNIVKVNRGGSGRGDLIAESGEVLTAPAASARRSPAPTAAAPTPRRRAEAQSP